MRTRYEYDTVFMVSNIISIYEYDDMNIRADSKTLYVSMRYPTAKCYYWITEMIECINKKSRH